MCTDSTRQEIAFLVALADGKSRSRLEMARDFPRVLESLRWSADLASEPRNFDMLFHEVRARQLIDRVAPFSWVLTDLGRHRLNELIVRFAPVGDRVRLNEAALAPA